MAQVVDAWKGEPLPDRCDVCIVGSGPAGSTLVRELSSTGLSVVLLESGDISRRPEADSLNDITNVGSNRSEQWAVRNRILGGSSHTWGGRCAPFDDLDFTERSWVDGSGWPLRADELSPYYHRSAKYLGLLPGKGFENERFWSIARQHDEFKLDESAVLESVFWQSSKESEPSYPFEYVRFGRSLARRAGENVTVVLGGTVREVTVDYASGQVTGVLVGTRFVSAAKLSARIVVLCAGGVENPRILLSSREARPDGVGNEYGHVGRYLMDHLRTPVGSFALEDVDIIRARMMRFNLHSQLYRAGFRLTDQCQEKEELLNCAFWVGEALAPDDPWAALRQILSGKPSSQAVRACLAEMGLLATGLQGYLSGLRGFPRKYSSLQLVAMTEQVPDRNSRITLSSEKDWLGNNLPEVNWKIHDVELSSMRRSALILAHALPQVGLPQPRLLDWVLDGSPPPTALVDVAHPTGTTRMGASALTGVCDPNGAVFGVAGLYLAGSSTFPTAGHCNPTQLIVALAIRLADHLKSEMHRQAIVSRRPNALDQQQSFSNEHKGGGEVLVTGGTGRIGRIVVQDLVSRGYSVRLATSSSDQRLLEALGELGDTRQIDFSSPDFGQYLALTEGVEAVVHLAAELGAEEKMTAVNARATKLLAEASEENGVRSFVYVSSVAIYGSPLSRQVSEASVTLTPDQDRAAEYLAKSYVRAYGRTKLLGENYLRDVARRVSYSILRPTVVVSEEDILSIRQWSAVKRSLAAHRASQYIYVHDVANAIRWALERGRTLHTPGVEEFVLSDESVDWIRRHLDFMRIAYASTGDRRFNVLSVSGIFDYLHDLLRFRRISRRNPLWRLRFSSKRIREAGYFHEHGMEKAYAMALTKLTESRSGIAEEVLLEKRLS